MKFKINHITRYTYGSPATESFAELRMTPPDTPSQKVLQSSIRITPKAKLDYHEDYLFNKVSSFSILRRHTSLEIKASSTVCTFPQTPPPESLHVSIAEARQIIQTQMLTLFQYLQPTPMVPLRVLPDIKQVLRIMRPSETLEDSMKSLASWVHKHFRYRAGSTQIATPLAEVISQKKGVCQDFAHLMLSIIRSFGLPARYVSGYIEPHDPESGSDKLVGAAASHAWVEVYLPGGYWWGLDPTNNQESGVRHIQMAFGRDYSDVPPMRGSYKGGADQKLDVEVSVVRLANEVKLLP